MKKSDQFEQNQKASGRIEDLRRRIDAIGGRGESSRFIEVLKVRQIAERKARMSNSKAKYRDVDLERLIDGKDLPPFLMENPLQAHLINLLSTGTRPATPTAPSAEIEKFIARHSKPEPATTADPLTTAQMFLEAAPADRPAIFQRNAAALTALKIRPDSPTFQIRAAIRTAERAAALTLAKQKQAALQKELATLRPGVERSEFFRKHRATLLENL